MALPTTITGLDVGGTAPAILGPFKSSGGNFYIIGRDAGAVSQLQCQKATDPASSFSAIGTDPTAATSAIFATCAYQVGDVIHVAIADNSIGTSVTYEYITFSMATDSWSSFETIQSGLDTRTSAPAAAMAASIVVRSDDTVVVLYNGARVASMGTSYSRIVYARRASGGGWTTNIAVDAGGAIDYVDPEAVLGSSDRTHLFWHVSASADLNTRALTSANALQTAGVSTAIFGAFNSGPGSAVAYVDGAATRVVMTRALSAALLTDVYFDSGNTPTLNQGSTPTAGANYPRRLFVDDTDVYMLYRDTSSDLNVSKSTDDGASWGTPAAAFTATIGQNDANLSHDGAIYQRGNDVVIPYVVNDNGTLKYNEYVVRTVVTTPWADMSSTSLIRPNAFLVREVVGY